MGCEAGGLFLEGAGLLTLGNIGCRPVRYSFEGK